MDTGIDEVAEEERDNRRTLSADIQVNVFTSWCNYHLAKVNQVIQDLETGFQDGLKLAALLQVLSNKEIQGKFFHKIRFRIQRINNIDICLGFLGDEEGIPRPYIEARDIDSGNRRLIEAMVWSFILKYHLPARTDSDQRERDVLLEWVKKRLPPQLQHITFSPNEWRNGVVLCALVNSFLPAALPNVNEIDPTDSLNNVRRALEMAEEQLGVPQIVTAEEMVNPVLSEMSLMTYVAFFTKVEPSNSFSRHGEKRSAEGAGLDNTVDFEGKKMNEE